MNETELITSFYAGWQNYQNLLIGVLAPLTPEQLSLASAPNQRTVEEIATHIIAARGYWFHDRMEEGDEIWADFARWDWDEMPVRTASEIVRAMETTWNEMQVFMSRWTPEQWRDTYPDEYPYPDTLTRPWMIWHLIEHDLHHGGEICLTLGIHGLPTSDR